ncbi:hypothetical protein EC991_006038 [Linnemannia zychae]|nr:hypothetical protein EC991_006038 [Linnemannia zychae]
MSRSQRQATTTVPATPATTLNDLLSDPYSTPSTSPSIAPTRQHTLQFTPSPLSSLSSTTATTKTTTATSSPSASSYHTIAGAAATHLIKQHQQQLALQQQIQQQAIQDNAHTLPAKLRGGGGGTITTAAAALNLKSQPMLPPSPRKNGGGIRIGQSILSQLLAAHSPNGRGGKGAHGNDNSLSLETHRPKEQQRRSILPAGWGLFSSSSSKSRTMHGPSLTTSKHSSPPVSSSTATGAGGPLLPSQLMENPEPMDRLQPVLPSVWLEGILSGLSRADLNTPPHYATLPRVIWQEDQLQQQQQQQHGVFPGLGPRSKNDDSRSKERLPSGKTSRPPTSSSSATGSGGAPSPSTATATLRPKAQTLHRKSSVCELALGDDARELFQQNRPKTLSSAVISSSIVPAKEELRRRGSSMRQRSLDSSVALSSTREPAKPASEPPRNHRASSGSILTTSSTSSSSSSTTTPAPLAPTPGTVKTTRGRFTIESSAALPSPSPRTRTLSCTSATALTTGEPLTSFSPTLSSTSALSPTSSVGQQEQQKLTTARRTHRTPSISLSPSSPTLSNSFPSSRSLHSASSSSSFPPSPRFSPSTDHTNNPNNNEHSSSNTTSSPISIPRATFSSASSSSSNATNGGVGGGRSSHQRSQSTTSSLSRFSQVIIPPPASAASLQFASFSSIGSPSRSSAPSESNWSTAGDGNGHAHVRPSSVPEKRPTNASGSNGNGNNIKNLSIQIADSGSRNSGSQSSTRRALDYEGEPTPVHPLDEDLTANGDNTASSSTTARTHQTMNRVHPTQDQDFVDSPGGSEGSSLGSRVGSLSNGSGGLFMPLPDRRASDNIPQQQKQQQQYVEGSGFGYYDRTSTGSFRPRSLSATNLDSVGGYGKNGSSPSLHQQLSWADRTAMQREGSAHSRSFDVGSGTPSTSSSLSPLSNSSGGSSTPTPESDIVMVKKSAKGRMFTVERQSTMPLPSSPTRSSRFIVVSSSEDMCLSSSGPGHGSSGLTFPQHSLH